MNRIDVRQIRTMDDALRLDVLLQNNRISYIVRGQSCEEWDLIPSIKHKQGETEEQSKFNEFKNILKKEGYFNQPLIHNDFRILGLAQHVKFCPTRFIDWTSYILVALYFACNEHPDKDGAIYLFLLPSEKDGLWLNSYQENYMSPFEFNEHKLFVCGSFVDNLKIYLKKEDIQLGNDRDMVQKSVMILCPKSEEEFENLENLMSLYQIKKILIPKENKTKLLEDLSKEPYLINEDTLLKGKTKQDIRSERKLEEIKSNFAIQYSR